MGFAEARLQVAGQLMNHQLHDHLMEQVKVSTSNAVVILPLQDVLGLSDDAHYGIPG